MASNSSDPSASGDGDFSVTDSQITFANDLASFGTIPGTCVCFLVLVAYGIVACFPNARKFLDRVSFRLLVYTLVSNVAFGIAYAATPAAPGPGCNFGAFCVNLFLTFSTFFTTSIAINLELVLVHRKNGRKLEKYYLIGTTLLTLALNVPTFALHQFGWDEQSDTCWYKNGDPTLKLRWIIGTQSFWIALAATIETVCSAVVLVWMYLYQRTTVVLGQAALEAGQMDMVKGSRSKGTTTKVASSKNSSTNVTKAAGVEDLIRNRPTDVTKDPRYRNAVLRIALYPIVSLLCNYPTVALDLKTTIQAGLNTQGEFRLLVLDLFLYGIRPLAYGLIAATDPSFILAVREMMGKTYNTRNKSSADKVSTHFEFTNAAAGGKAGDKSGAHSTWAGNVNSEAQSGISTGNLSGEESHGKEMDQGSKVEATSSEGMATGIEEIEVIEIDYEEEFLRMNRQL